MISQSRNYQKTIFPPLPNTERVSFKIYYSTFDPKYIDKLNIRQSLQFSISLKNYQLNL